MVGIPRRSVRALLYRLACTTEAVTRGHLQLLFWPDVPDAIARRNLSHHLTHLRRSLPLPRILLAGPDSVQLEHGLVSCDVVEFRRAAFYSSVDTAPFQHFVSLYRGPFLDGFDLPGCPEFEHWCILERSFLERQYLRVLARLVELYTLSGDIRHAVQYAQRFLEIDPLSEAMHQRLIQLYFASGDRHLALRQFEQCAAVLKRELGLSPLPETCAIYQTVTHPPL